jgi:hypothetical protein
MALIPISKETHGNKRIKPISSFAFLAKASACDIVAGEFSAVAPNYPIIFVKSGEEYVPLAVMGLREGENLFVEPNGVWMGLYQPAALRRYPFAVAQASADGETKPVLMIDEDCGLLSDTEGEPLFGTDDAGEMNSPVGRVIRLITETDAQRQMTRALVAQIAQADLMQAANVTVQAENGPQVFGGMFTVDEKKLGELPDDAFLELRRSGALPLIYMHLVSLGQMARLQALHAVRHGGARTAG